MPDHQEHVLGTVDGIEIVLRALRCTDEGVTVELYGRANALTEQLDATFQAAWDEWEPVAIDAKRRGVRAPDPPTQPGTRLSDIPMTLSDDAGTAYEWRGSQAAGTGTEWDALRHFAPPPPPEATLLTVAIDGADARPYSMSL
jgi:hypothetical protein